MICKGYILDKFDYREKDIITTLLTEQHGIVSFIVPGGKKKEGFLQFFDLIEFLILDLKSSTFLHTELGNHMPRITQICTLKSNTHLINNSFSFFSTRYLIEVIRVFVPTGRKVNNLFRIMHGFPITSQFEFVKKIVLLFKYFGFYPDIHSCSECGKKECPEWGVFSEMMFLCSKCGQNYVKEKAKLDADFFKILKFVENNSASSLVISKRQFEIIMNFFSGYLKFNHNIDAFKMLI